jgi:plastocyanin
MRHALIATLLAGALLAGCGSSDKGATTTPAPAATPAAAPVTTSIAIKTFTFSPTPATVKAGRPITISNADASPHTFTDRATDRAFDSGTIKGHSHGSVTFSKPGTYAYFCEFHPYMKGSITVTS